MKPKFEDLNEFARGYLTAAFWTNDNEAPGGCDYRETGRPQEMYAKLAESETEKALADCLKFMDEQAGHLRIGGLDDFQAGSDFWLTRNRHGAGFWDGDWPETQAEALTEAAHAFGETDLYEGDDGQLYFSR